MKTRTLQSLVLTITAVAAVSLLAGNAVAQDSSTATTASQAAPAAAQPAAASQAAPQLSYGVVQILQLSQAKVGDSTVIAYIRNSGNNYGLDTAQIIYLKQQGVSSDVIDTMLNQRTQTAQSTAQTATVQPTVSYVQTAPPQTVYVIPDTQTYDYYANNPYYYPYYSYYGWPYPPVSFSFGWGGYYGGGYRGGWGGGGHGGGSFHGGGGHHH
jgi:uncharacterized membrane protein YgcG